MNKHIYINKRMSMYMYTLYLSLCVCTRICLLLCVHTGVHTGTRVYQCLCLDSFPSSSSSRTQGNSQKLVHGKFQIDASGKKHAAKVVGRWYRGPKRRGCPPSEILEVR